MSTNSVSIEGRVTKGCPQGSRCGPGFWNLLYSPLLKMELTRHSKVIAYADDVIILTKGESIVEAENCMNLDLRKISEWADNNELKFNENKSKVILMSRRKRKEKKEIEIYLNNKMYKRKWKPDWSGNGSKTLDSSSELRQNYWRSSTRKLSKWTHDPD